MIELKKGDTFAFYADIKNESGDPLITNVSNLKCQIRDVADVLHGTMVITSTETAGKYLFTAGSTDLWPIGILYFDVQIKEGTQTNTSATVEIRVLKDVTRDD